jgi:hypothetical protein
MKILATIALTAALTTMTNADAGNINLSAMTCHDFIHSDFSKATIIVAWFMGFYGQVEEPQLIDLNKLEDTRGKFLAFCKQQPNFRMTTAADGLLGSAQPEISGAAQTQ